MTDAPDTSREAVEALAKTDRKKFVMMGPRYLMMKIEEMADVLRALLDERDALKAERDVARRAAFEEAASLAEAIGLWVDHFDCERCAKEIRALSDKER